MDTASAWMFVTRWGNSLLLLPTASCIGIGLWAGGEHRVAARWVACFGGAVLLVLASKVAFLGWGVGIRDLDFTGISGHSTLAASVLPMLAWWLTQERSPGTRAVAIRAAIALGIVVGVSRVLLSTHSLSEVTAGLVLGSLVARAVIPHRTVANAHARYRWAVAFVLLIAGCLTGAGNSDEAHGFVVTLALQLSGHSAPYTRDML